MLRKTLVMLSLAAAPFVAAAPALAASIDQPTNNLNVRGTTLAQLDRELSRKGPTAGTAGTRHPGATKVSFGGNITYAPTRSGCRVNRTNFSLKLVKILPRWQAPKAAAASTVIIWRTLAQDIARHENDHAKIARNYVRRMEGAVLNLGPRRSCREMEAAVNAVTARYLREHEREQLEFDRTEGRDVNRRLQRLLKRNIAESLATN